MNPRAFSAAQEVCGNMQNKANCDSSLFITNPLKAKFILYFLIAANGNYSQN